MVIRVNGQTIEIFSGARVGDVLLKYSRAEWDLVRKKGKRITDPHGHDVALDGELIGGEELVISDRVPEKPRS
jgi:hypothetical protein